MIIWDIHCHPDGFRVPGATLSEKVDQLLSIASRMRIERLGLFLRPQQIARPGLDGAAYTEREVVRVLEQHRDRVMGFLWVSLWSQTTQAHIDALNRWVRDGPMVGMKMAGEDGKCSLPVYDPVFEHAARLRAAIYIHSWYKVGVPPQDTNAGVATKPAPALPGGLYGPQESQPTDVATLAARRPEIPHICGHSGGDWELGIRAIRGIKNVIAEIAGSFPTRGFVEMAVRELGPERVIYGSDAAGRSFASQLGKVYGANIPQEQKELVFSGNLRRIMRPILTSKGIHV